MTAEMAPELRWCLAALAGQEPPSTPLDAGRLLATLCHHRLLLRLPLTGLAAPLADRVKHARHNAAIRSMAGLTKLFQVTGAFDQHGISTLCLKGPALAALFGPPDRLRISHDFDLLIQPGQRALAEAVLRQLGYQPDTADPTQSPWHGHSWRHRDHPAIIELHHRLTSPASLLPPDRFDPWQHTQPITVHGHRLTGLTAPACLVYLAVHGAQHVWWRLFWLGDIADALADASVDWAHCLTLARMAKVDRHLLLSVALAQQLLNAPLPPALAVEQAAIAALAPVSRLVQRGLALTPMPERRWVYRLGLAAYIRWHWQLAPTRKAGWEMLAQILWPASSTPITALRRWLRIAGRTWTGGPPGP